MSDLNLKIIKDYVDKKVAGTLTGKSAYEIAVEQGYEGTEKEWLSEMKNYEDLENKPQINSHILSGNKSSDDLGLQKKLTAGTNITIANDGTISASGGVTSYNDLTNKPRIRSYKRGVDHSSFNNLQGILSFEHFDFEYVGVEGDIEIKLTNKVFKSHTNTLIG